MLKKSLLVVLCAGMPVVAQEDAAPWTDPGVPGPGSAIDDLGDQIGDAISVDGGAGQTLNTGRSLGVTVAFDAIWATTADGFLSNTAVGCIEPGTAGPALILKYDLDGTFLESYEQPAGLNSTSCWGYRDGAKDEANNKLWWGAEGDRMDEWDYDPGTGDITFNQTYTGGSGNSVIRALARSGATGNFYTANFSGLISEFDISSGSAVNVNIYLNQAGPGGAGPGALYGMAYDADNDTFWGWSQNADPSVPAPNAHTAVFAAELDPNNDMVPTGREFFGSIQSPVGVNNIAGGADIFVDPGCGEQVFIGLHQASPIDVVVKYELDNPCDDCYADCTGEGTLDIFDFLCFQDAFVAMDPYANCDNNATFDIFDFLCFQDEFVMGCP